MDESATASTPTEPALPAPAPARAPPAVLPPSPLLPLPDSARLRLRRAALWTAGLALLLILGGAVGWYGWWRPLPVAVLQPSRGNAVEAVYATGIVEAVDTARVGSVIAGRIVSLAVDEGDEVHRGDLLAVLDDRQAQQRLRDAQARLALAQQEMARNEALVKGGYRSQEAVQQARKELDQAKAAVELFTRQLEDYRITSPMDGIVMKRPVEPGESVAANGVLFEIASPARLRVAADVDERDIAQVRMGAPVAVRADAFPDEAFEARVTNIRRQGDVTTRTFRIEAELPPGTKLLIGMTLDVNIVTGERANALLIPRSAVLHEAPQGGRPGAAYVYRLEGGRAERTPVVLGAEGTQSVEVRSGLGEQDEVIADPGGLAEGRRVAPASRS